MRDFHPHAIPDAYKVNDSLLDNFDFFLSESMLQNKANVTLIHTTTVEESMFFEAKQHMHVRKTLNIY